MLSASLNKTLLPSYQTKVRPTETDHPSPNRYIRMMHLQDRFRTATSTASRLLDKDEFAQNRHQSSMSSRSSCKATYATKRSHGTSSPWTTSVVSRTYFIETCTMENSSLSRWISLLVFQSRWTFQRWGLYHDVGRDSPWWSYCRSES